MHTVTDGRSTVKKKSPPAASAARRPVASNPDCAARARQSGTPGHGQITARSRSRGTWCGAIVARSWCRHTVVLARPPLCTHCLLLSPVRPRRFVN
jgi:hypothetical protein